MWKTHAFICVSPFRPPEQLSEINKIIKKYWLNTYKGNGKFMSISFNRNRQTTG